MDVVKIEQRSLAEYDHVAADAIADLRYPKKRPWCVLALRPFFQSNHFDPRTAPDPEKFALESISHINDDRSPLLDLMTCLVCGRTMVLEKAVPDGSGNDLIHYRCDVCDRKETVRLIRRSRTP